MLSKIQSQLQDLETAQQRLQDALEKEKDDIVRDAVIQRFEFTFELTWKSLSTFLKEDGIEFKGIKSLLRDAARIGLLDEPEVWFTYLEARNLTTHTYDLEIAEKVYIKAKQFNSDLKILLPKLKKLP